MSEVQCKNCEWFGSAGSGYCEWGEVHLPNLIDFINFHCVPVDPGEYRWCPTYKEKSHAK